MNKFLWCANLIGDFKQLRYFFLVSQSVQRPKSSLRPPSVRPSSARPGAPRLRPDSALPSTEPVLMGNINVIVESVDNIDDEETVIIENNPEVIEDSTATDISLKNKGHLVEQILEQIKDGETISHVEVDWNKNGKFFLLFIIKSVRLKNTL